MTYEELVELAVERANYPEVADVVVSDRMFRVAQGCSRLEAEAFGQLRVIRSEFLADGYVLGRDCGGMVIRIWGPNGEMALPLMEGCLRIGWKEMEEGVGR